MTSPMAGIYLSSIGEALGAVRRIDHESVTAPGKLLDELCADGHTYFRQSIQRPWELAIESARQTLSDGTRPDLVVYCTNTFDDWADRTSGPALFLEALGLHDVSVTGVAMSGCGNLGAGLQAASAMLEAGSGQTALVVTTDVASGPERVVRGDIGVFSDGAASCLLSTKPRPGSLRLRGVATGAEWRMYTTIAGGLDLASARAVVVGLRRICGPLLRQHAVSPEQITHLVTNNYKTVMLKLYSESIRVDPAKVFVPTLSDVAHCHSADVLLNLSRLLRDGVPDQGKVLLLSTGTHTWTCVLLETPTAGEVTTPEPAGRDSDDREGLVSSA